MTRGTIELEAEKDGRRVRAWCRRVGDDLVVAVGGGERPHVGCVVLAQGRPSTAGGDRASVTVSLLTIPPHKEEPVARGIAELLARELGGTVVVTAGIHDDGLTAEGIAAYLELSRKLGERLLAALRGE